MLWINRSRDGKHLSVLSFQNNQAICVFINTCIQLDVAAILGGLREAHQSTRDDLSSLVLYRSLQPVYCHANYLSSVNCF